jgi:hypothetical protein
MTTDIDEQYAALGIEADTWACVAIMSKRDAADYLFRLAAAGVPALLSRDADGKRWHIAIRGGLKASPMAWLVSIRADDTYTPTCADDATGQHPQPPHTAQSA